MRNVVGMWRNADPDEADGPGDPTAKTTELHPSGLAQAADPRSVSPLAAAAVEAHTVGDAAAQGVYHALVATAERAGFSVRGQAEIEAQLWALAQEASRDLVLALAKPEHVGALRVALAEPGGG